MKDKASYHIFLLDKTKEPSLHAKLGYKIFTDAAWKLEF